MKFLHVNNLKTNTMKKILLSILIIVAIASGCTKEKNQPNNGNGTGSTPVPTTGTLYFQNTKTDPYIIYLDGTSMGTLLPGTTSSGYTITSGISHAVKSQQASGYIVYPTVYTGTATLNPGGSVTWSF